MAGNSGGIRAGRAYVEAGWQDSALNKGLKATEAKLKAFGASTTAIGAKLGGLGVAATAPFLGAAKAFADAGSTLNDMSARTGVSVEGLSALGFAAQQTGTDLGTVEGGARKMQKNLVAAAQGSQQAQVAFGALGLNAAQLVRLKPEAQFAAIAAAINRVPSPAGKAAAAMSIFGKSGTALLPMIQNLDELTAQAAEFGLIWTDEEAKNADALGDALDLVAAVGKRVVGVIGSALAPMLTEVAVSLARVAKTAMDWVKANQPLAVGLFKAAVAIAAVGAALVVLGPAITAVAVTLGVLLNPLTWLAAALVGGVAAWATWTDSGKAAAAAVGKAFDVLKADALATFGGIADALSAGDIATAAGVLWASLKVQFAQGFNVVVGLASDAAATVVDLWTQASFAVAHALVDAWATVQFGWESALDIAAGAWDTFQGMILKGFVEIEAAVDRAGARIVGMLNPFFDAQAELDAIDQHLAGQKAAVDQHVAGNAQARAAERAASFGVEAQQAAAHGALDAAQAGQPSPEDRAASFRGMLGGLKDVAGAREEFQATLEAARAAAAGVGGTKLGGLFGGPDLGGLLDNAGPGVDKAQRKVDVAGGFNAAALGGLGVGESIANDQLKEQKKTNDKLDKLNDKIDSAQMVFED